MARAVQGQFTGSAADAAEKVDELVQEWLRRLKLVRAARAELVAKIRLMPWWAQPGPTTLLSDGSMAGSCSWVPAIQDAKLPQGAIRSVIRPTERDYKERYLDQPFWGDQTRQRLYEKAVAKLKEREAARDALMKEHGVKAARDNEHRATGACYAVEREIEGLPPSPVRLAATTIFRISHRAWGEACFSKQGEVLNTMDFYYWGGALKDLIPVLSPGLAALATRIIKPGGGIVRRMPIWPGYHEFTWRHGLGRYPMPERSEASADEMLAA